MEKKLIQEAEEQLKRALLMMKYDSSKTLTENKDCVFEQTENCPNLIDYDSLLETADRIGNVVKKMDAVVIRMGYGVERAKDIYETIKELVGKNTYDDLNNRCVNAIDEFKTLFYKSGSKGLYDGFGGLGQGFKIDEKLKEFIDGYYSDNYQAKRYLIKTLELLKSNTSNSTTTTTTIKPQLTNKCEKGEKFNPKRNKCEKEDGVIPPVVNRYRYCEGIQDDPFKKGCIEKDPNGPIHKVQSCLGGLVSDGKFWVKTEAALFNKTKKISFTKDEVSTICSQSSQSNTTTTTTQSPQQQFGTSGVVNLVGGTSGKSGAQEIEVDINDDF